MTKMKNDIAIAEERLTIARFVERDFSGKKQGGLARREYGDYTIVDDGQDRWIIETVDLNENIESVIAAILDGECDNWIDGDPVEQAMEAYNALCQMGGCIYSRIGSPSDPQAVLDLDIDEDLKREILEDLGIEAEEDAE